MESQNRLDFDESLRRSYPLDNTVPPSRIVADHLANERTFLSWIRTALALLGFGFVLARVGLFLSQLTPAEGSSAPQPSHHAHEFVLMGTVFIVLGVALSAWSGWHYQRTRKGLDSGQFVAANRSVSAVAALGVVAGFTILMLIWMNSR